MKKKKLNIYDTIAEAREHAHKVDAAEVWEIDQRGSRKYMCGKLTLAWIATMPKVQRSLDRYLAAEDIIIVCTHDVLTPADRVADEARKAREREVAAHTVTIYLSSRGWGDYTACTWSGDIRRPDAEILAECRTLLSTGHDIDNRDQTDAAIIDKIHSAREWRDNPPAPYVAPDRGNGYCHCCQTWCYGDCRAGQGT